VSQSGLYLQRNARISTETPSDLPHQSARFNLGFFASPTQTWRADYPATGTGNVPNNTNVGITIAGTGTDWTLPNNNIRRTLTLRSGDGSSVVVQWWESDEQLAFKPQAVTLGSACSASSPFVPPTLPPVDTSTGIQLSVPCSNPSSSNFGTPQPYNIVGYSGNVYITGTSSPSGIGAVASATSFFVVPTKPDACTTRVLQYGQEFYLLTQAGLYLERYQRISTETPSDLPHQSARFNLGFDTSPSQTWRVDYATGATGNVPYNKNIGITIAGNNTDWTKPDNNIRRTLTLRSGDGSSVVVQWWESNEQIAFQTASYNPSSSCSPSVPF